MAERKHDEGSVDHKAVSTVHAFPVYTFAENLAVRPSGDVIVCCVTPGDLVNINPKDGSASVIHSLPDGAGFTGIASMGNDIYYVSSGVLAKAGTFAISKLDMSGYVPGSKPASFTKLVDTPDALLLNGSAALSLAKGLMLSVDSFLGLVYIVDVNAGTIKVWLKDKLLGKCTDMEQIPGVNGVKIFGGYAYFSNTDYRQLLRIAIDAEEGTIRGELEVVEENCNCDDFVFDSEGSIYLTSHFFNSVYKIAKDGKRSTIAGGPTDRDVAGTTACAFGADPNVLYVTTNGGMSMPIDGQVGPGRLLKIDLGRSAA